MDLLDYTNVWSWTSAVAPIPPVPPSQAAHSPHDWRAVNPRMRRIFLRGILPEEFEEQELKELRELTELDDMLH